MCCPDLQSSRATSVPELVVVVARRIDSLAKIDADRDEFEERETRSLFATRSATNSPSEVLGAAAR